MKKENKFITLKPGIKLVQSTSKVKACAANPCEDLADDCFTNGSDDCLAYPDPHAVIRCWEEHYLNLVVY